MQRSLPMVGPEAGTDPDPDPDRATLPQHMVSALFGILYDTRHWKKLPVRSSGPIATWTWILTRQGRFPYIMLWVTSLGLLVLIVVCLAALRSRPPSIHAGGHPVLAAPAALHHLAAAPPFRY